MNGLFLGEVRFFFMVQEMGCKPSDKRICCEHQEQLHGGSAFGDVKC